MYGKGCKKCNHIGYKGRTAIFEIIPISPEIADAINHRATAPKLLQIARQQGMRTLQESALIKLKWGITSWEEVMRETELLL